MNEVSTEGHECNDHAHEAQGCNVGGEEENQEGWTNYYFVNLGKHFGAFVELFGNHLMAF